MTEADRAREAPAPLGRGTGAGPKLLGVVLTLNEARHITACLESLRWTDGLLVVDSFSRDATVELAQTAGAEVEQHRFVNYSAQRNVALEAAARRGADWLFFVDADERATPALAAEVRRVITERDEVGWWVPRHNYIFGHRMRGAGWWPDYQLRLLRVGKAHYDPGRAVHEVAELEGEAGYLREPLIHYNYERPSQFIAKQRRYTAYDAGILLAQGTPTHWYTPYTQALRHFWWRFVTLEGWRDGGYGLLLSAWMAYYEAVKYRMVRRGRVEEG